MRFNSPRKGGDDPMSDRPSIPEVLRLIMQEAQRTRSPEEDAAARRLILGHGTLGAYMAARRMEPRSRR